MILLPAINEHVIQRPGNYTGSRARRIPDDKDLEFWNDFYARIKAEKLLIPPVKNFDTKKVNPYFGYFGKRFHQVKKEPYYHIGLDISGNTKNSVLAVADGILEYSGFGVINGNYVLLQHKNIQTEDGYILFSMYLHLKKYKVGFSKYQKMLREISLHTYPEIAIPRGTNIGLMGDTGNAGRGDYHTHIQLEFRKDKTVPIALDPLRMLGYKARNNKTGNFKKKSEFEKLLDTDLENLKKYNLLPYWKE